MDGGEVCGRREWEKNGGVKPSAKKKVEKPKKSARMKAALAKKMKAPAKKAKPAAKNQQGKQRKHLQRRSQQKQKRRSSIKTIPLSHEKLGGFVLANV